MLLPNDPIKIIYSLLDLSHQDKLNGGSFISL